jgi:hypothetical protein
MPATRRAKTTRKAEEFTLERLIARLEALRVSAGAYSWSLSEIQAARDAQMAGDFKQPARLSESFATDDAMYTARRTRLAPQRAIPVKIKPARDAGPALRIANEADALFGPDGVGASPETMVSINAHLADHGVAFGANIVTPRPDGSRVDIEHHAWPIEWVRWDTLRRSFVTQVDLASTSVEADYWLDSPIAGRLPKGTVPIVHGDGRFAIYAAHELEPWKHGVLLPGALVWARHAFGWRDLLASSAAHGNPKLLGELPPNVKTKSPEGDDFLALLVALASADMPVGLRPNGSSVEYVTNSSRAWEIFRELITGSKSSAGQIYNGHDGTLGSNPNAPGIDLTALLGVMSDIAEGDLHTIERCFKSGVIDVWAALNFGSSELAPQRLYEIPDADQDARRKAMGERRMAFYDALEREKRLGFDLTVERVQALAKEYDVSVPTFRSAAATTVGATPAAPAMNGATNGAAAVPAAAPSAASPLQ